VERQHGLGGPELDHDERDEPGHREGERPPDVGETPVGALDQPVGERAEPDRGRDRPRNVEPSDAQLSALATDPESGEHDRGGGQRQVDEKDPPP
jgi:hypothetical protein